MQIRQLQNVIFEIFSKQFPPNTEIDEMAAMLANRLSELDPCAYIQSLTHSVGSAGAGMLICIALLLILHAFIRYKEVDPMRQNLVWMWSKLLNKQKRENCG